MKKHQLRQELRSHLEQVLEEQRPRNSPIRSPQAEYARALQLQMEEARVRESPKSDAGGAGWGGWFDDPQSFQSHLYRTAEQQRLVLLEQMEEVKLRREAELRQRMEDELRWEAYYARQRHSPVAAAAAAAASALKPPKTRREIEQEIRQLQLQLREMDDEDEYSGGAEDGECGGYEDDDFSQEEEEEERVETSPDAQPLKVKSRYFVYVAKPSGMSLPEESASSSSTSNSSSEEEEDQRGPSQAAQAALRRADSSNPLPPLEQQLSINSFLDASPSSPARTPPPHG